MAKLPFNFFNFFNFLPNVDNARLDDGRLFIGETGKMPTDSPVKVWLDENLTIPAPLYLLIKNGFMWHNGDVIDIYVDEMTVSLLLLDVYKKQLIYIDNLVVADVCGVPISPPVCVPSIINFEFDIPQSKIYGADIAVLHTTFYQTGAYINNIYTNVDTPYSAWVDYVDNDTRIDFIRGVQIHWNDTLTYDYGNDIALQHKLFFYNERSLINRLISILTPVVEEKFNALDLSTKISEDANYITTFSYEVIGLRSRIEKNTGNIQIGFLDYEEEKIANQNSFLTNYDIHSTAGNLQNWRYIDNIYPQYQPYLFNENNAFIHQNHLENYFDYIEYVRNLDFKYQRSGEHFSTPDNIYPYIKTIGDRVMSVSNFDMQFVLEKAYYFKTELYSKTTGKHEYLTGVRTVGVTVPLNYLIVTRVRDLEESPTPLKLPR